MKNNYAEINSVKTRIIDYTLIIGSVLGLLAFVLSLVMISNSAYKIFHLFDFIIIVLFGLLAIFRKYFSIQFKSIVIILGLFIIIFADILKNGVFADNKILIIVLPFFSFLSLSKRNTIVVFLVAIIGYSILAYLFSEEIIKPLVDYTDRAKMLNTWLINILLITIVSAVVIILVSQFNNTFYQLLKNLSKKNVELKQSEQQYRDIFESSTDAIFIHNLDGSIFDVNQTMLSMYGYECDEMKKLNIDDLTINNNEFSSAQAVLKIKDAIENGENRFDWIARKKDGTYFWVEVFLKTTKIVNEKKILAIVRDIDEKKRSDIELEKYRTKLEELVKERTKALEKVNNELVNSNNELVFQKEELKDTISKLQTTQKQLVHAEKMASLGIISTGIAHEINNPLNYIKGGAWGLKSLINPNNYDNKDEVDSLLNAIDEGIKRATNIVTSLEHLSYGSDNQNRACNVNDILEHCITALYSTFKHKVEIKKNFSTDLFITGNESKLHHAFLNILTNAEQAIETNGEISIETKSNHLSAIIIIKDNGIGMNKELLPKIETPFFTTKEPGKGTGLGLSIAYNIISDHKGSIKYKSEPGIGTTVSITLPKAN